MPLYDSNNGHTVEGKYVKIVQGKELNIRLASEIAAPGNLLYPAYQQARKAAWISSSVTLSCSPVFTMTAIYLTHTLPYQKRNQKQSHTTISSLS